MELEAFIAQFKDTAQRCGCILPPPTSRTPANAFMRKNVGSQTPGQEDASYFGLILDPESTSGPYTDFSLVIFPQTDDDGQVTKCLVTIVVGSLGFEKDIYAARKPYWRRTMQRLIMAEQTKFPVLFGTAGSTFIKSDFSDLNTQATEALFANFSSNSVVPEKYGKYIVAAAWIDLQAYEKDSLKVMCQWVAQYAKLREWGRTAPITRYINGLLPNSNADKDVCHDVQTLLEKRRYVVVQGAPGVGKTYTASKIANKYDKVFFEQFHAGTTFSDFVWGIRPRLDNGQLGYEAHPGVLYQAIKYANSNPHQNVLLIIDEINRANLANVLGPVFYLFEPNRQVGQNYTVTVGDMKIALMPENLHVVATMNTADRNIAVVDFALRRRFAWYTLLPQAIDVSGFDSKAFDAMARIFDQFATDAELELQPGPSYFVPVNGMTVVERMRYELMPLIKEYLEQGYLTDARDTFVNYFLDPYKLEMYR